MATHKKRPMLTFFQTKVRMAVGGAAFGWGAMVATATVTDGAAGAEPADKSGYSLLNPTPAALLREMNTDRPDATEGPFTVDAGRLQLEMDFANYARDDAGGGRIREWGLAPFNLRVGLRQDLEAGVFVAPYLRHTETTGAGGETVAKGFGDVTLRVKKNFWGNDGGESALGLIVDVKLPTAAAGLANGAVEGTVLLPLGLALPGGWELGAMTGSRVLRRDDGGGRDVVWINSVTVGHDLAAKIAGYVEVVAETGAGAPVATFDAGLTFKVDDNVQLDVGGEWGLSAAADDALMFAGLSRRF